MNDSNKMTTEQFLALSLNERWVAVAQDVLARLRAGQLMARSGGWCSWDESIRSPRELLDQTCRVCAVGGAMVSLLGIGFNLISGSNGMNFTKNQSEVETLLGKERVRQLEYLFECGDGALDVDGKTDRSELTDAVGRYFATHDPDQEAFEGRGDNWVELTDWATEVRSEDAPERLLYLCRHIIDHGGRIVPGDLWT